MQKKILKMKVNLTSVFSVLALIKDWCADNAGRYVCVSNVHMCMEAYDSPSFLSVVNEADLAIPDGLPLVWAQKLLGHKRAEQVRGADLTLDLCEMAEKENISVGFFGATPELLLTLRSVLCEMFPGLDIAYSVSPPFREISFDENQKYIQDINLSDIKILGSSEESVG